MEFIADLLYGYPSFLGQCYRGLCPNFVKEDLVIVPDAGMAGVSDSVPPEKIESPGSGAPGHLQDVVKCVEIGYLFRTIPVQHSGDTRSLFCE